MPKLLIVGEDGSRREVELAERDLVIGRAPENDVVLPDPNKGVSRMHAELRYENGRYVIIDLNSQNGTWIDGQRVQRAEVLPNAELAIGPYRLHLHGVASAAATMDTQAGQVAAVGQPTPTAAFAAAGHSAAPAPAPQAPVTKRPTRPPLHAKEPPKPGLIAAVARMPKPMIFGAFFVVALVIIVLGQLFAPGDPSTQNAGTSSSSGAAEAKPAGETNEQIIARHLTEGKALVDKGEYEAAIRDHFDRVLIIDPNHAEATDLKAKADEKLQAQRAAAAAAASSVPAADAGATSATTIPPAGGAPPTTAPPAPPAASASTVPPASGSATAAAPATTPPPTVSTVPPPSGAGAATPSAAKPPGSATTTVAPPSAAPAGSTTSTPRTSASSSGARTSGPPTSAKTQEVAASRRPGESAQAYRARSTTLLSRYTSSKAALDRGEYATAAAGFDAILKEEPGFLDAPQLLLKARQGMRGSARDAFEAGNKLDAAGDWVGAMQKYEQARRIDPAYAGLDDAMNSVREKMRAAGADAFKRARQYDALGRSADAVKDYEKAAQFLPADDPNKKIARDRADQLKAGIK